MSSLLKSDHWGRSVKQESKTQKKRSHPLSVLLSHPSSLPQRPNVLCHLLGNLESTFSSLIFIVSPVVLIDFFFFFKCHFQSVLHMRALISQCYYSNTGKNSTVSQTSCSSTPLSGETKCWFFSTFFIPVLFCFSIICMILNILRWFVWTGIDFWWQIIVDFHWDHG